MVAHGRAIARTGRHTTSDDLLRLCAGIEDLGDRALAGLARSVETFDPANTWTFEDDFVPFGFQRTG